MKNSYLLKSQNCSYVYFTHTKMWRIRANNSQRVKNTKFEYKGSTKHVLHHTYLLIIRNTFWRKESERNAQCVTSAQFASSALSDPRSYGLLIRILFVSLLYRSLSVLVSLPTYWADNFHYNSNIYLIMHFFSLIRCFFRRKRYVFRFVLLLALF